MSENKISTGTNMWISKSRSLLEVCFVCQPADGSYSAFGPEVVG